MTESLSKTWKQAYAEDLEQRRERLLEHHEGALRKALSDVGLDVTEFLTPLDAGLHGMPVVSLAARVTGAGSGEEILSIRLISGAANDDQRYQVNATGECRVCGRRTALSPWATVPPRRDDVHPAVAFGEALTNREPAHDCGEAREIGEAHGPGQYL